MNKIFRLVNGWAGVTAKGHRDVHGGVVGGVAQPAPEVGKPVFHRWKGVITALALAFAPVSAWALAAPSLPTGGSFAAGTGTISSTSNAVNVNIASGGNLSFGSGSSAYLIPYAQINWGGGFDISSGNTVNFTEGSGVNVPDIINVDTSGNPSTIAGTITAPSGVGVAVINANGLSIDSATASLPVGFVGAVGGFSSGSSNGATPIGITETGAVSVDGQVVVSAPQGSIINEQTGSGPYTVTSPVIPASYSSSVTTGFLPYEVGAGLNNYSLAAVTPSGGVDGIPSLSSSPVPFGAITAVPVQVANATSTTALNLQADNFSAINTSDGVYVNAYGGVGTSYGDVYSWYNFIDTLERSLPFTPTVTLANGNYGSLYNTGSALASNVSIGSVIGASSFSLANVSYDSSVPHDAGYSNTPEMSAGSFTLSGNDSSLGAQGSSIMVNGATSIGNVNTRNVNVETGGALTLAGSAVAGSAGSIASVIPISAADIGNNVHIPITLSNGAILNTAYYPALNSSSLSEYPVMDFNESAGNSFPINISGNGTMNLIDMGLQVNSSSFTNGITTIENFNVPGVALRYKPFAFDNLANTVSNFQGGNFSMSGSQPMYSESGAYFVPTNLTDITTSGSVSINEPASNITISGNAMTPSSMNIYGNNVTVNSNIDSSGNMVISADANLNFAPPSGSTTETIQSSGGAITLSDYTGLNVAQGVTVNSAGNLNEADYSTSGNGGTGISMAGNSGLSSGGDLTIDSSGNIVQTGTYYNQTTTGSGTSATTNISPATLEATGAITVDAGGNYTPGAGATVQGGSNVSISSNTVNLPGSTVMSGTTIPGVVVSSKDGIVTLVDSSGFTEGAGASVNGSKGITISDNSPAPTTGSTNTGGVTLDGSLSSTGGTIAVSSPNNDVTQATGGTMNATDIQVSAPTGTITANGSMTTGNGGVWIDPATITYSAGAQASAYDKVVEDSAATITGSSNLKVSPKAVTASSAPSDTTISLDGNAVTVGGTLDALLSGSTAGAGLVPASTTATTPVTKTTTTSSSTSGGGGSGSFSPSSSNTAATTTITATTPVTKITTVASPVTKTTTVASSSPSGAPNSGAGSSGTSTSTSTPAITTTPTSNSLIQLEDVSAAQNVTSSGTGGGAITVSPTANTATYSGSALVIPAGGGSGTDSTGSTTVSSSSSGGSGGSVSNNSGNYTSGSTTQRKHPYGD